MAGAISGIAAAGFEQPYQNQAETLANQGVSAYGNLSVPDLANKLYTQNYTSAGNLTPAQEQTINAAPSQAAATQANPALVNAQMQALQGLKTASNTGYTPATQAALNQIQRNAAVQSQGQQQAVMNQYAQRGQAGSGNQLLAQLNASQNAGNQANQQSTQAAGQASQNALNALRQYGGQAGAMNQQQFGQQFQTGTAADQLNRFNTQNQVSQQARNVANQNAAQQYNLQNQQGIQNANTGLTNQNIYQQDIAGPQQMYQDAAQRAGGLSGASFTGANVYGNIGQQVGQGISNIGGGVDSGVGALMMAEGGEVPYGGGGQTYDVGGTVNGPQMQSYNPLLGPATPHYDGGGSVGQYTSPTLTGPISTGQGQQSGNNSGTPDWSDIVKQYLNGGQQDSSANGMSMAGEPMDNSGGSASNGMSGLGQVLTASRGITIPNPNMNNASKVPLGLALGNRMNTIQPKQAGLPPAAPPPKNPAQLAALASLISRGGSVPGKAMYRGDTIKNDRVHTALSPGEIVLPRSVATADDAPEKAADFVAKEKAKKEDK